VATAKPNVSYPSTTSGDMGQWSSGYQQRLFNEKINEKHTVIKNGRRPLSFFIIYRIDKLEIF